jgi:hypothetical protein
MAFCSHVLQDQMRLGAGATGDLTLLLTAIQVTSKFIATNVRKARLINLYAVAHPQCHKEALTNLLFPRSGSV